ncbi:MAG: glycosyltransferase family 2 protein [Crenarchaeota archaeon]|nr:glycosyltransferase family 2 protein [Thermoproteota archaeon]MDW8033686.1 glycosyltransferase family 2 protein [Nitrososphaerota archaeon]
MGVSVSVIIPSFRGSPYLIDLVKKLVEDNYRDKEVLVVVDNPLPKVAEELRKQSVKTIFRNGRLGRVSALIEAFKQSSGELLIFLDDDVSIVENDFLSKIVESMMNSEIGEIMKRVGGKGILAQTIDYEFMSFNYGSLALANKIGRCIGLNGAAFAIWRRAYERIGGFKYKIPDDFDLGIRSYLAGLRFSFITSPYVVNYAPPGWREWFKQRVRWGIGAAIWIKENWRTLLKIMIEKPSLILLLLFIILPSLAPFLMTILMNTLLEDRIAWLVVMMISSLFINLLPFTAIFSYGLFIKILLLFTKTLIAVLASFIFFSLSYYMIAKKMGYRFKLGSLAFLYFVYSPLWFTLLLSGFIRVFIFRRNSIEGRP